GDTFHTTPGRDNASAVARWPSHATTRPANTSAPAISKRSSRRSRGGRRPRRTATGRGTRLVPGGPAPLLMADPAAAHNQLPAPDGRPQPSPPIPPQIPPPRRRAPARHAGITPDPVHPPGGADVPSPARIIFHNRDYPRSPVRNGACKTGGDDFAGSE